MTGYLSQKNQGSLSLPFPAKGDTDAPDTPMDHYGRRSWEMNGRNMGSCRRSLTACCSNLEAPSHHGKLHICTEASSM